MWAHGRHKSVYGYFYSVWRAFTAAAVDYSELDAQVSAASSSGAEARRQVVDRRR